MKQLLYSILLLAICFSVNAQKSTVKIGVLKYNGGGDWYANPTSVPNLVKFCNKELPSNVFESQVVDVGSAEIFNFAMVHMTGHGNVLFSNAEVQNLRLYLESGGFLHIDDNYGMDMYVRRELKKVFPESQFVELSASHQVFHQKYDFPKGLPKIHEHDGKPAQAFGLFYKERLVCLYTYECDLGDGWEDKEVHNDSDDTHNKALRMGANIVQFTFTH